MKTCLSFVLLFLSMSLMAQEINLTASKINLSFTSAKARLVFDEISRQSGLIFSYSEFDDETPMSIKANNEDLSQVIVELEKELQISISIKGRYAIVKQKKIDGDLIIRGTIRKSGDLQPVSYASIYIKEHKKVTNTNANGEFMLKVPQKNKAIILKVAKENFADTSIVLVSHKNQVLDIYLNAYPQKTIASLEQLSPSMKYVINDQNPIKNLPSINTSLWQEIEEKNYNLRNISDTFKSVVSLSLFPPLSTNKLLSFNTRNSVAINLIGGTSKGTDYLEIGGVFNIDRGSARYLQVAGVANVVYEDVDGMQVSGVFNSVRKNMSGLQIGGSFNYVDSTTTGLQVSGLYQYTRNLQGMQLAGFYNQAKTVKGVQISGFLNQADTLTGIQLGIINISKKLKGGLPIGLFNYVKEGYHKVELSYDELGFYQLGFRSGIASLHMHYRLGMRQRYDKTIVQGTIGLATSLPLTRHLNFEIDANTGNYHNLDALENYQFNMKNQLMLGFAFQPLKKVGIRLGAGLNHWWYHQNHDLRNDVVSDLPKSLYENTEGNRSHQLWLGYQLGIIIF